MTQPESLRSRKAQSRTDKIFDIINYTLSALALLICFYPLYYVLVVSFSKEVVGSYLIPNGFTTLGYQLVLQDSDVWVGYANTVFYTVVGVLVSLAVTLPAAYALSRKDLRGRGVVMGYILITMFVSGGLIPSFLLVNSMNLTNTRTIIILLGSCSAYNIIVSRTFFATTIPGELLEASQIDGCGNARFFMTVVLPLSKPIVAVIALYVAVGRWNSYYTEMIYLRDLDKYPLALMLKRLLFEISNTQEMIAKGELEATRDLQERQKVVAIMQYVLIVVSTIPVMAAYPYLQKYFAKGVMIGSVKG